MKRILLATFALFSLSASAEIIQPGNIIFTGNVTFQGQTANSATQPLRPGQCDGVTDVSSLVNAALSQVAATGGGTVQLPEGTCYVGAALAVGSNTHLQGAGRGATIIKTPAAPSYEAIKMVPGVVAAAVSDLTVNGNSTVAGARAANGIVIYNGANNNKVFRVEVENVAQNGIEVDGSNNEISSNYVHDNWANGIYSIGTDATHLSSYNSIHDNDVENNSKNTITWDGIDLDPQTSYSQIYDNLLVGNDIIIYESGTVVSNSPGHTILNNKIINSTENGIDVTGPEIRFVISGNQILNTTGHCILMNGSQVQFTISNNYCFNPTQAGLLMENTGAPLPVGAQSNGLITGNKFENVSGQGSALYSALQIGNGAFGLFINDNHVIDTRGTQLMKYAVDLTAASENFFGINEFNSGVTGVINASTSGSYLGLNPATQFLYSAAGTPLPTCNAGSKGQALTVSDATAPTYNGTYTSGGAIVAPVVCNGTNWLTH
jgi:hypothetical protein